MKHILLLGFGLLFASGLSLSHAAPLPAKAEKDMRIVTFNIRNGRGMDNKTDLQRTGKVIRSWQADVVALQEVDNKTRRSGGIDISRQLGEQAGMRYLFAGAIPYQGGEYGVALLSKEKPVSHQRFPLPGREEARMLLVVEFERCVVGCTHLSLTREDRIESVKTLNRIADRYGKPAFLVGDLNARPGSETITELNKQWSMLSPDREPTYPADKPRVTLDYIFGSKSSSAGYQLIRTGVIDEPMVSDHRPVFVDLELRGQSR